MLNAFGAAPVMGPWQGGLAQPVGPPSRPRFGTGALTLLSQTDASSGSLVSYVGGIFTAQFWTTGHQVPFLVRELDAEDVKALRDELSEQLDGTEHGARRGPAAGVRGQSHRTGPPGGDCPCARARASCARLILALSEVQRGCGHGVDPLWSELRDLAQAAVTARDSRRFW